MLTFTSGPRGEELLARHPDRVVARIGGARGGTLHEVIEADAARVLMRALTEGTRIPGADGVFDAASKGPAVLADYEPYALVPTTLGQTVIACGAAAELKIRRHLLPGRSHEQRILGALADNLDVELPMAYASLDLLTPDGRRWPFILLRSRIPHTQDGWERARHLARQWLAEPHDLPDRPDPFAWLREGHEAPRIDSEPLHELEQMMRAMGRRVAVTHSAFASADAIAADEGAGDAGANGVGTDRQLALVALNALTDLPEATRSRWAAVIASPAAEHLLASRQVLGALARWRWVDDAPTPVDPDDSTPGSHGAPWDLGVRDIAALAADLAYVAFVTQHETGGRDEAAHAARTWWAIATWALARGWQEELAAAGHEIPGADVVDRLGAGTLWRLLVDAVSAANWRRDPARAMLADLAVHPVGGGS